MCPEVQRLTPVECLLVDFQTIRIATQLGVIVVEAAGNGNADLDDPRLNRMFDRSFRDSGAIIVGASVNSTGARWIPSGYGSIIDANGWGDSVATTGYGDLFLPIHCWPFNPLPPYTGCSPDMRQAYTAKFGGTSSASAMVAAVVVAMRGAALAQLSPADAALVNGTLIRSLLRSHGTPMNPGQGIGLRPDLRQLFIALNLQRGLRVLGEPALGQTVQIELAPPFSVSTSDRYAIVASPALSNQALPPPFTPDSRLLISLTNAITIAAGSFGTVPAQLSIPVPTTSNFRGTNYFVQGVVFQSTGSLYTTNVVQLHIRR